MTDTPDTPTVSPDETPDINPDVVPSSSADPDATTEPAEAAAPDRDAMWNTLVTRLGFHDLLIGNNDDGDSGTSPA